MKPQVRPATFEGELPVETRALWGRKRWWGMLAVTLRRFLPDVSTEETSGKVLGTEPYAETRPTRCESSSGSE